MPTLKEVAEQFDITEEQANQLKQGMSLGKQEKQFEERERLNLQVYQEN